MSPSKNVFSSDSVLWMLTSRMMIHRRFLHRVIYNTDNNDTQSSMKRVTQGSQTDTRLDNTSYEQKQVAITSRLF